MNARPEMSILRAFFARVNRRLTLIAAAEGAAGGLVLAAVVTALATGRSVPLALIVGFVMVSAGIALRVLYARRRGIARLVEQRAPQCRNVVITAAELMDTPTRVRADIGALVVRHAERVVKALNPATLFPARRALVAVAVAAVLWVLALVVVSPSSALSSGSQPETVELAEIAGVEVVVTPPAYAAQRAQTLRDPSRIDALEGSRIHLTIRAVAAAMSIETIAGRDSLARTGSGTYTTDVIADADGYVAIEATTSDGRPGARRLIGLSVTPDRAPRAKIVTPGRDLFLADGSRTLALSVEADDDLALGSLRLRYTKVSGSGERFTFTAGERPLEVVRTDERTWTARGSLPLGDLSLERGDVIVYRAVATDRRPGAPPTESDAFIVEITAPGAVASEGFALDDEMDRYAVSQQMVILKTERLIARRSTMATDSATNEARTIAAEQRQVRAEFVFMMGGELAEELVTDAVGISELHEEAEAEAGDDILAGRMANRGRVELVRAIRSMSEANAALNIGELDRALTEERLALDHLQRAFSRTRYILRALTERERLDLTRRLSGALTDAAPDVRPVVEPTVDPQVAALRRALSEIAALSSSGASGPDASARLSIIAQGVLRVDPSAEPLQKLATRLDDAATATRDARTADARTHLDSAALDLAALVRARLVRAPTRGVRLDDERLGGALSDALRRGGPSR